MFVGCSVEQGRIVQDGEVQRTVEVCNLPEELLDKIWDAGRTGLWSGRIIRECIIILHLEQKALGRVDLGNGKWREQMSYRNERAKTDFGSQRFKKEFLWEKITSRFFFGKLLTLSQSLFELTRLSLCLSLVFQFNNGGSIIGKRDLKTQERSTGERRSHSSLGISSVRRPIGKHRSVTCCSEHPAQRAWVRAAQVTQR